MKKLLILVVLFALPLLTVGQNTDSNNNKKNDNITIETVTTTNLETKTVLSTAAKAELDNLNYKKSNDLISIKAYKKSLQIKVKDIKIC